MNYTKLASEARKLYSALRNEEFDAGQAYEITKACVRDYPIFREMIEVEQTPEESKGYIYYTNGTKDPIYKIIEVTPNTLEIHAKDLVYRKTTGYRYHDFSFINDPIIEYVVFADKEWRPTYIIDHIELF